MGGALHGSPGSGSPHESDLSLLAALSGTHVRRGGGRAVSGGGAVPRGLPRAQRPPRAAVGSGRTRAVVQLFRPGEVDGDMALLLRMPAPYTARAARPAHRLVLDAPAFQGLILEHPALARRWPWSVAARLARSQERVVELLGKSLSEQVARLLLDEAVESVVALPQRTLARHARRPTAVAQQGAEGVERSGLIRVGYSRIELLDHPGLQRAAAPRARHRG